MKPTPSKNFFAAAAVAMVAAAGTPLADDHAPATPAPQEQGKTEAAAIPFHYSVEYACTADKKLSKAVARVTYEEGEIDGVKMKDATTWIVVDPVNGNKIIVDTPEMKKIGREKLTLLLTNTADQVAADVAKACVDGSGTPIAPPQNKAPLRGQGPTYETRFVAPGRKFG